LSETALFPYLIHSLLHKKNIEKMITFETCWSTASFFGSSLGMQLSSVLFPGDNLVKLLKGKGLVRFGLIQNMRVVHHLKNLLVVHCLPELASCDLHFLEIYLSDLIVIVKAKYPLKTVHRLAVSETTVNNLKKLLKVDRSVLGL
jgi:hypothetical protein